MEKNGIITVETSTPLPAHGPAKAPPRILVVDDEDDDRQLLIDVLVFSGYEVQAVKDGAAGWEALKTHDFDLIVTDNKMPKVSGVEMIEKLRSARMNLPVIMVTGYLPAHEFVRRPWLKPDIILEKPFSTDDLLAAVKKLLGAPEGVSNRSPVLRDYAIPAETISQAPAPAIAPVRERPNLHQRILVVDDNPDTRRLSVDVLVGSGYDADGVRDGAAGWEALQANDYDLVITDNQMPRMTGLEMIAKLRSATMTVPVIMATRHLPMNDFARRPWLKPNATLEWPFSTDDLLFTVKKILHPVDGGDDRRETLFPNQL
jgi:CheY-like chemotaxis protein